MQDVVVLGAGGSVGRQTAEVILAHPDRLRAVGLAGRRRVEEIVRQAAALRPRWIVMDDPGAAERVRTAVAAGVEVAAGADALLEKLANLPRDTAVMAAMTGFQGLRPALAAAKTGARLMVANKETLVAAGRLMRETIRQAGGSLVPVDSEHSALLQALGHPPKPYERLWLTCSGGPFRGWTTEALAAVTVEDALRHPVWRMGPKNTLDSATLMNKGLEMLEAHFLFDAPMDKIGVVVHPEGVVHSMVEFPDGAMLAQLASPDMRLPIQVALSWPDRWVSCAAPLGWREPWSLSFEPPNEDRFPALTLARRAGELGGTAPAVFNAANEIAGERFLAGDIRFLDIAAIVEAVLADHQVLPGDTLSAIEEADGWARARARAWR